MYPRERILNRPIRLNWGGWETDTYKLGSLGWQISAEQNIHRNIIRLSIRHPKLDIVGISNIHDYNFHEYIGHMQIPISLNFKTLGRNICINSMSMNSFDFSPVETVPRFVKSEVKRLEDIAHFATVSEVPKNEVYLHEANINQILEMALKIQEPEQEQIRREMLHRQEMQKMRVGTLHTELRLVS